MNKSGNKKDGVGIQIANPNLIVEEKTLKKEMNWNPETPLKEVFENNNLTSFWIREAFSRRRPLATEFLVMQVPFSMSLLMDFVVDLDFIHSFSIISALLFESLLAISLRWV